MPSISSGITHQWIICKDEWKTVICLKSIHWHSLEETEKTTKNNAITTVINILNSSAV
jgi:hypothetical protein